MTEGIYSVLNQEKSIKKNKGNLKFRYESIAIILIGFFIGQADIAGLFPLALIYLTILTESNKVIFSLSFLTVTTGLLCRGDILNIIYITSALIGSILYKILNRKYKELDIAMLNSFIYMVLSFLKNYFTGVLAFNYLLTAGEAILIYILSYISLQGSKQLFNKESRLTRLALITILIISSGFLIGLSNIEIIPRELINIIIYLILFSMANTMGFNYTILTAVLYGLILLNTGVIQAIDMFSFIIFSFSSALFKAKKKRWMIIGAIIGFLLTSGFSSSIYNLEKIAFEVGVALSLFMIVPLKYWSNLYFSFLDYEEGKVEFYPELNKELKQHLNELSQVFNELSVTFKETITDESPYRRLDDFAFIFNSKVCGKCKRRNICWQQEKEDTYKRIFLLLKAGEDKGFLSEDIIDGIFKDKCPYTIQIIAAVKVSFEIHQINNFWQSRLKDKQEIVSEQLAGIGIIIDQFSIEPSMTCTDDTILEEINERIKGSDIDIYNIELHTGINSEKSYFTVKMEQCSGNCPCSGQFLDLLNSRSEYNYRILEKSCGSKMKDEPCEIVYGPVGNYRISIANILKSCSDKVSGDSFLHKRLKDGKDLVVISDGMGVGEKAAAESRAAINLLESIIDAGFDQSLAVKTINSALYLRNQEESFTTLDICLFDTFTGKATFSKIGAVASYIKRDWDLIKIDSASLPAGILEKIEVSTREIELKIDDFVIMFTDGMLDIRYDIKDKEEWLRQILQNSSFDKAEDMLDYILDVVLDFDGEISDDMTIAIIKIEEVQKKRRKFKGLPRIV